MNGYEALAQLPEEVRKLALAETKKYQSNFENFMTGEFKDLSQFLLEAFYWKKSNQGNDFWAKYAGIAPVF